MTMQPQAIVDATTRKPIPVTGPYKVDTSKGGHNGVVSSQWFSRPADQRFTSLNDLYASVKHRNDQSRANVIDAAHIRAEADMDKPDALRLVLPDRKYPSVEVEPNHWAFSQLSSLLGVPGGYLRKLPAPIAAINMQYALANFRSELVKSYVREDGTHELRAVTGPDYGRIYDHQIVEAVRQLAGDGVSDTRWKIPGVLNWKDGTYDPYAPVSSESTTLYASDRDIFLFLVDDTNPVSIGKLPNGDDDLVFRGFYVFNSEVGSKRFGLASFFLRGVCMNRNLWGVEEFKQINIRHSKNAPARAIAAMRPVLSRYAESSAAGVVQYVDNARKAVVANTDEERSEWLLKQGFTKPQTKDIIAAVLREEDTKPRSVWDFVNGITAVARGMEHQDSRIDLEQKAADLMAKANK